MKVASWSVVVLASGLLLGWTPFGRPGGVRERVAEVVLVLSTDCPVAMRYTPRINALVREYAEKGVAFRAIFPNDLESRDGVARYMAEREYAFPYRLDLGAVEAKRLGVTHVPTALVFDAKGRKVYQGAIDDNKDSTLVRDHYLRDVLAATVAGTSAPFTRNTPAGCLLMPGEAPPAVGKVTYAEHAAPILDRSCVACHRPGEVAPFSLFGYENARKWAPMIAQVAENRRMPPWKAVHGYGEFLGENRLSELEIETLRRWNEAGAPRGATKKAPAPPKFDSEWTLGEPDAIVSATKPFALEADGADVYRNFVVKTDFKETRWIRGIDVRPGNKRVVHHVIAFLDQGERAARLAAAESDGQEGYTTTGGGVGFVPSGSLGGWAPGLRPNLTPEDVAFELKPGTTIVLQVHYHKSGKPETDLTKVGLYFADKAPKHPMTLAWMANPLFRIPAGASAHKVALSYPIRSDVALHTVMPHMHLLGRSMKAWAEFPDGSSRPLVWIDDWDFNWQLMYVLKEPMFLPKGTRVRIEGVYDNSTANKNNPHRPPKDVTWGEETTDEMFLLVAAVTPGRLDR
ncbi:MAG: redoxin family protein [Fimbriimonadaceae bacterium]|nr:redoxin family protein [Fimbriimonadaceae bacterium]